MPKILPIALHPHPALARVAEPAEGATPRVLEALENMLATLYAADGVGLAAPQVDIGQRLVVMDLGEETPDGKRNFEVKHPKLLINPEIIWSSDELAERQEGCLSLPGLWGNVSRPAHVRVAYINRDGQRVEEEATGLAAACIQHEIDHLNGVIFVQRMTRLRKEMAMKKWKKLREDLLRHGGNFPLLTEKGVLPPGFGEPD